MARCTKKWPSGNAGTEIANVILGASSDIINDISGSGLLAKRAQVQFVKSKKGASKNRPMGRFYSDRKKMQREREREHSARISVTLRRLRHVRLMGKENHGTPVYLKVKGAMTFCQRD